ncbi:MAG: 6,7-dimethyl-8-ribityllumazine synthase [Bacteroidales bacterium]|nr:6,7-dimethyl-8-ribityllumazine synthase [Bacteroidales bacterium]MBP5503211.1 6,7-dimethyl-8-ribityllumazine synthase [Bacteroidales bacterium]MDD6003324.1 6,7-dimethyl-8-ribityllumazine synthase [Bacteroidales bacterium]
MASNLKNLSDFGDAEIPNGSDMKIGIAVAQWNKEITSALFNGAKQTLLKHEVKEDNIISVSVPGTFELTLAAQNLLEYTDVDAVIVLGCVIQGETRHFDFICQSVTQGVTELNIKYNQPVIFGVLTTNNLEQAQERAGGKLGNKGDEAAVTALQMVDMQSRLRQNYLNCYPAE